MIVLYLSRLNERLIDLSIRIGKILSTPHSVDFSIAHCILDGFIIPTARLILHTGSPNWGKTSVIFPETFSFDIFSMIALYAIPSPSIK